MMTNIYVFVLMSTKHNKMAQANILREWAPLTDLYNKLPLKSLNGLFSHEIKITCLDILPEFLALGSNIGIVYWYNRQNKSLEHLRCENSNSPITVVKVISTVDFMVACGNAAGNISIFQIPKSHASSLPESLITKNKQVERYTVSDLHKSKITAVEWSKNGMKLFSGDKNGCIILTELDFYMHICKSVEILNEEYEVVQMSYNQQRLLVSTTYRSIICQKFSKWKVCQVGKKDRKVLGNYGGLIFQNGFNSNNSILYCSRPGLRIWVSDIEGNVQKTLLFKDILSKECLEVPLINPISKKLLPLKPQKEACFSVLYQFCDNLLVTHNGDVIYILDPNNMIILYTISHLRGVLNIASHKDEIFILEEDRSIIRISYRPENSQDILLTTPVDNIVNPLTSSIKDFKNKFQTGNIISALPSLFEKTPVDEDIFNDDANVPKAEEATECSVHNTAEDIKFQKNFDDIGKQQFNDKILFKKKKKRHMSSSLFSLSSNSSEERDLSFNKSTIMNLNTVGALPDLRSPDSIQNDIEYKEKILADVLNLDKIQINLDEIQSSEMNDRDNINSKGPTFTRTQSEPDPSIYSSNLIKTSHSELIGNKVKDLGSPLKTKELLWKTETKNLNPDSSQKGENILIPDCRHIPNEWKLTNIEVNKDRVSET